MCFYKYKYCPFKYKFCVNFLFELFEIPILKKTKFISAHKTSIHV